MGCVAVDTKKNPAPGERREIQNNCYPYRNQVRRSMPSAWETLAVDALALLVSSTAEVVQYATARRGVTATDFPRLYRPAYLVLLECAEEHINTGSASERVDMVQFGQRLQEKQHSTGTRVWRRISNSNGYSAHPLGMAELGLINNALTELTSQAAFQHLQAAQAQTQQCLDTATLTGIGRAMEHLQKAQDAGQRAGLIDQRRGGR